MLSPSISLAQEVSSKVGTALSGALDRFGSCGPVATGPTCSNHLDALNPTWRKIHETIYITCLNQDSQEEKDGFLSFFIATDMCVWLGVTCTPAPYLGKVVLYCMLVCLHMHMHATYHNHSLYVFRCMLWYCILKLFYTSHCYCWLVFWPIAMSQSCVRRIPWVIISVRFEAPNLPSVK